MLKHATETLQHSYNTPHSTSDNLTRNVHFTRPWWKNIANKIRSRRNTIHSITIYDITRIDATDLIKWWRQEIVDLAVNFTCQGHHHEYHGAHLLFSATLYTLFALFITIHRLCFITILSYTHSDD